MAQTDKITNRKGDKKEDPGKLSGRDKPERILLIRLKSIGDVLHTLPALNAVRKNNPHAHISFLVCKSNESLLAGFAALDEVITIDRAALKKVLRALPTFTSIIRRIRTGRYSHVIDFQGYGETAWLSLLTGAKRRWGSVYRKARRKAYTQGIDRRDDIHVIDWNLTLLEQCGMQVGSPDNSFTLPEPYLVEARQLFTQHGLDPEKSTLIIQPFTSRENKNWPLAKFLSVAEHFRAQGIQILFCGGPGDAASLKSAKDDGFTVITGESLLVTAGLIKLSHLVIGGDTGILHLAVALNTRVIMLLNRPASTPGASIPYRHPEWVIDPSGFGTLAEISVDRVITECAGALDSASAQKPSSLPPDANHESKL